MRHPEASPTSRPWRRALLTPFVFDAISQMLQRRRRLVSTTQPNEHVARVVAYNLGAVAHKRFTRTRRAEKYYRLLPGTGRLLIIGPRDVHELFIAWCYGYRWRDIDAIDLYAKHPKIRIMNMEHMTFPLATFDAVAMSHTLAYAEDTGRCLEGIARVLRPQGLCSFGATYVPEGSPWLGNQVTGDEVAVMLAQCRLVILYHDVMRKVDVNGLAIEVHDFLARKQ